MLQKGSLRHKKPRTLSVPKLVISSPPMSSQIMLYVKDESVS